MEEGVENDCWAGKVEFDRHKGWRMTAEGKGDFDCQKGWAGRGEIDQQNGWRMTAGCGRGILTARRGGG